MRKVLLARVVPAALVVLLGRSLARARSVPARAACALLLATISASTPVWWAFLRLAGNVGRLVAQGLPPAPTRALWRNRYRINEWMVERTQRYGEGATWHIGPGIIITSPECVKHILKDNFENYVKGPAFKNVFQDLLGDGIFNSNGATWRVQRRTGLKIFTRRNFSTWMVDVFKKNGADVVGRLQAHVNSDAGAGAIDMQQLYYKFTLDSIGQIGFGTDIGCLQQDEPVPFAVAFDRAQLQIIDRFLNPLWMLVPAFSNGPGRWLYPGEREVRACVETIRAFGRKVIAERRDELGLTTGVVSEEGRGPAGTQRQDLLSYFLLLDDQMQDQQLIDIVLNFMLAGRDTTAATLSWATYHLMVHNGAASKVIAEVDSVLQGRAPTYGDVTRKMPYTKAFLQETLRLHPPVPKDVKQAVKRDVLPDGTHVPAGSLVVFVPYVMGRSRSLWGDDVLDFVPERWLPPRMPGRGPDAYTFPVFQGGARTCLGKNMAYFEAATLLAMLLQRFTFHMPDGAKEPRPAETVTMPVHGGLPVLVKAREPPTPLRDESRVEPEDHAAPSTAALPLASHHAVDAAACPFHQGMREPAARL